MESLFSRFKNPLVLITLLFVQTIALAVQVRRPENGSRPDGQHVRLVRLWANALVLPFERTSTWSGHGVRGAWGSYVNLRHVKQQNEDLQKQLAQLKLERAAIAEDAVEARRLRGLLEFRQHYIESTVAAQVIGTSGSDQSRLLILDKGADAKLKPGMAVITPDGAVGKLRDVFPTTSQLLLLNDPTSGAGVLLQSTRIRAVLHGAPGGAVVITNLPQDDRIKPGETVLTSGGDQVFPRGLPVGKIESVTLDPRRPPFTTIVLKPAANLFQLEDVLVVTATGDKLNPQTEQELAADAAETMHAADVSAERLPHLHEDKALADPTAKGDGKAGETAAPPADNSTELVPKPKPALHADRYSPGSAPPAAELTPGAARPATDAAPREPGSVEDAPKPKPKKPAAMASGGGASATPKTGEPAAGPKPLAEPAAKPVAKPVAKPATPKPAPKPSSGTGATSQ